MTDQPYGLDFFQKITDCNWGTDLILGINMGVGFTLPPIIDPQQSIRAAFSFTGGNPGLAGFVDNDWAGDYQNVDASEIITAPLNPPITFDSGKKGVGFVGRGSAIIVLSSTRPFQVAFPWSATIDGFGNIGTVQAVCNLLPKSALVPGLSISDVVFDPSLWSGASTVSTHPGGGTILFTVYPARKLVVANGGG